VRLNTTLEKVGLGGRIPLPWPYEYVSLATLDITYNGGIAGGLSIVSFVRFVQVTCRTGGEGAPFSFAFSG
jgi:hypothetical protein